MGWIAEPFLFSPIIATIYLEGIVARESRDGKVCFAGRRNLSVIIIAMLSDVLSRSTPLSPVDRNAIQQQQLLSENQRQRRELERRVTQPEAVAPKTPARTEGPCFMISRIDIDGSGMISVAGNSGHVEATTQAAVADGTITIRDKADQKQDVANLSRDTEHANSSISPIFDKEKEQSRLKAVGLISDIGSQAADIARTQGEIIALKEARRDNPNLPADKLKDTPKYKE